MFDHDETGLPDPEQLVGPAQDFAAFAVSELERRRNSEADFDGSAYARAVRLVVRKLVALKEYRT